MAGANLPINLRVDDRELLAALRALQTRLGDLTPIFRELGEMLLNSTRDRFRSQTAPDGSPWAALSPAYQARKRKHKDKILTLDGRLRGTLAYQAGPDTLRIGTPLVYGATHQFGAAKGSFGTVTARIKAHTRKVKSRDLYQGRRRLAQGVAFVKAHTRRLPIPWGNVPARPFLDLSAADRKLVLTVLHDRFNQ